MANTTDRNKGILRRVFKSKYDLESEDLMNDVLDSADSKAADFHPVLACTPGEKVTVSGMIRSVTYHPGKTYPHLEIEVYDGSGSVDVIWMGRRRIPGIVAGRRITVHGRLNCNQASPTIFNPRYELKPFDQHK